jgi:hypothetical protein
LDYSGTDKADGYNHVLSLLNVKLTAEVAVLVEGVGWQDVATLVGTFTLDAGAGPTNECDIYIN